MSCSLFSQKPPGGGVGWELTSLVSVGSGLSFWTVWSRGDSKLIHRELPRLQGPRADG